VQVQVCNTKKERYWDTHTHTHRGRERERDSKKNQKKILGIKNIVTEMKDVLYQLNIDEERTSKVEQWVEGS
jgi:hypothetical protein